MIHSKLSTLKSASIKVAPWKFMLYSLSISISRMMSKTAVMPKNLRRFRDHGFDKYMDVEKNVRPIIKLQNIIQMEPKQTLSISRFDLLARKIGFKANKIGKFILKFPHVFEIYEHPVQRVLYCRLTRKALMQIEEERRALLSQIPDAIIRLRRLLMLSNSKTLPLKHVKIARNDLGLPDDFEDSVLLKNPNLFKLFDGDRDKCIELLETDPDLSICAIEKEREREYREKGGDAENLRFSFIVNFPPGFKMKPHYKSAVWNWQRIPYWSPYEDVSGYDMRSIEAQRRMEKTCVATIHELLSLTVEKKLTLERIAHFRSSMGLPKKLKEFLLQHQGIFYISTRGNYGKIHTVFLREAYQRGDLIFPNGLYFARRILSDLVVLSPSRAELDPELFD